MALAVPSCGGGSGGDSPLEVVAAWTAARNDGDVQRAMALVADDGRVLELTMPDERAVLVGVLEAQAAAGAVVEDSGCVVTGERVVCRYVLHDEILRRWGLALTGTHTYRVRDGKLVQVDRVYDDEARRRVLLELDRFRSWVKATHPDVAAAIWTSPGANTYSDRSGAQALISLLDEYEPYRDGTP